MRHHKRKSIITWVAPQKIIYVKKSEEWPKYIKYWPTLTCPGNWDIYSKKLKPFREEELRDILLNKQDYKTTESYIRLKYELNKNKRTKFPRCHSEDEIEEYFNGLTSLYQSIKEHGCKPADQTGAEGDIAVRISRNGELMKYGQGTHRLAIARLLELKSVPVCIDIIHPRWVSRCKQHYHEKKGPAIEKWLAEISTRE